MALDEWADDEKTRVETRKTRPDEWVPPPLIPEREDWLAEETTKRRAVEWVVRGLPGVNDEPNDGSVSADHKWGVE